MKIYKYENLEVYELSSDFIADVYKLTSNFPKSELFGLITQLRRASVSVVLNIVEGSSRLSNKDFAIFIERSIGSLMEVRTAFCLSERLGFAKIDEAISNKIDEIYFKLQKLKKYLRQKQN